MFFRFSDGLACVSVDGRYVSTKLPDFEKPVDICIDGEWGFINTSGNFVIKPLYQAANNFSDGLAPVKLKGKYGYIDLTGNFIIPPQYDSANRFSEGLAFVRKKDINGFINKKGEFAIKLDKQQTSSRFVDRLAIVQEFTDKEIKFGVIDKNGKFVIPLDSKGLSYFKEGIFSVRIGSKSGYMDRSGKYIWKPTE